MQKKAFIIGANKDKLKYAVTDAEKIRRSFLRQDYIVASPEVATFRSSDFLYALKEFVDDLKEEDQLIFYFVGHSFLGNNNELYLAIESSDINDAKTCIGAAEITFIIQQCRAKNKMIVLDSCHSAALLNSMKLDLRKVNYAIICASEAWKRVPELETDGIRGGFLSHFFYQAMSARETNALNFEHQLSPNSLNDWLLVINKDFKSQNVPEIRVVNNLTTSFVLAKFDDPNNLDTKGEIQEFEQTKGQILQIESITSRLEKAVIKTSMAKKIEIRLLEIQLKALFREQEQLMGDFEALSQDKEEALTNYGKNKFQRLIDTKLEKISQLISSVKLIEYKLEQAN